MQQNGMPNIWKNYDFWWQIQEQAKITASLAPKANFLQFWRILPPPRGSQNPPEAPKRPKKTKPKKLKKTDTHQNPLKLALATFGADQGGAGFSNPEPGKPQFRLEGTAFLGFVHKLVFQAPGGDW